MNFIKKSLQFFAFFILAMMMFAVTALAYIDPSAMTFIIQLIAGIAIAAGATLGFYWRKIKRSFSKNKKDTYAGDDYGDDEEDDDDGYGDYDMDDDDEDEDEYDISPITAKSASSDDYSKSRTVPSAKTYVAPDYDEIEIPEIKASKYDEEGGAGDLIRENLELRRLLAEEREKVEILKKSLHICTLPAKK